MVTLGLIIAFLMVLGGALLAFAIVAVLYFGVSSTRPELLRRRRRGEPPGDGPPPPA